MVRAWIYPRFNLAPEKLLRVVEALRELGFEASISFHYPHPHLPQMGGDQASSWADFAIAVGGDGTLLRAFHEVGGRIPLLGVNSGESVGFLLETDLEGLEQALRSVAQGAYRVEEGLVGRATAAGWSAQFANDVVIAPPRRAQQLLRVAVVAGGEVIAEGRVDGLIVATPTGSTAYAMSAGGPIVDPLLNALAVVPIAPLTALFKPVVVSADRELKITVEGSCTVVVDGLFARNMDSCTITISRAETTLKLIRTPSSEPRVSRLRRRLLDMPLQAEGVQREN